MGEQLPWAQGLFQPRQNPGMGEEKRAVVGRVRKIEAPECGVHALMLVPRFDAEAL